MSKSIVLLLTKKNSKTTTQAKYTARSSRMNYKRHCELFTSDYSHSIFELLVYCATLLEQEYFDEGRVVLSSFDNVF